MKFLGLDAEQWWMVGPTVALVLVTIVYVVITGRLAGHAKSSAENAEKSVRSAQRSLQLAALPIYYGRAAGNFDKAQFRVAIAALTSAPAFRMTATVKQDGRVWQSGLKTYLEFDSEFMSILISANDGKPNFDKPYDISLEYYDALGTGYRTRRVGYLVSAPDFHLDEWDEENKVWENLV